MPRMQPAACTTWTEMVSVLTERDVVHLQDLVGIDLLDSLETVQRELSALTSILSDAKSTSSIRQSSELDLVLRQIGIVMEQGGGIIDDHDPVIKHIQRRMQTKPEPRRRRSPKLSATAALEGDLQALIDIRRALVADEAQLRMQIDRINGEIEECISCMGASPPFTLSDAKQTLERIRHLSAQLERLSPVAAKVGRSVVKLPEMMRRPPGIPRPSGRRRASDMA